MATMIVFGAPDPEAALAERLARGAGWTVAYATVKGVRVHPGNAYAADDVPWAPGELPPDSIVLFECGGAPGTPGAVLEPGKRVTRLDHHRPGDPGYGRPPAEFLEASSVGQLLSLLARRGLLPRMEAGTRLDLAEGDLAFGDDRWQIGDGDMGAAVPPEIVMAAAADHCLEAAYRGLCPGVDPEALMRWRAESRAAFQKRPVADVLADVESARRRLRAAVERCDGARLEYADFRGEHIPELPEAACREGIAFLSTIRDRDGREKVILQAAPADLVRRFLAGEVVPGLQNVYGDPARGFAGGYTAAK